MKEESDKNVALPQFKQLVDEVKKEIREIDCAELGRLRASGEDFALIDVREPGDWACGTIPGAAMISRGMLELNIDQITSDLDKKIVLYCGGGSRSALAAYFLQRMGFRNVLSLAGGFGGWKQQQGS